MMETKWSLAIGVGAAITMGCSAKAIDLGSDGGAGSSGGGGSTGPTTLATQVQVTPWRMVSDGTTLFWLGRDSPTLSSMPVGGGTITTLASSNVENGFLAVDDTNVYFEEFLGSSTGVAIYGMPKAGGTPKLAAGGATNLGPATTMGASAYWLESGNGNWLVKTAPLKGGTATQIGQFDTMGGFGGGLAATSSAVFIGIETGPSGLLRVPTGNGASGSPMMVSGVAQCQEFVSTPDAAYCYSWAGSVLRIASDGTTTSLGMDYNATGMGVDGPLAVDDTFAYWADFASAGTITKVPTAGGAATVIAHDTSPAAVAVDAHAVYWSDDGGNIMRLPK